MKKSINIGLILFLLFQACSSPENTSEIIENPLPTDPPDLENMPSPPPPGEENFPENAKKQENTIKNKKILHNLKEETIHHHLKMVVLI